MCDEHASSGNCSGTSVLVCRTKSQKNVNMLQLLRMAEVLEGTRGEGPAVR